MAFVALPTRVPGSAGPGMIFDPDAGLAGWPAAEAAGALGLRDPWVIVDRDHPAPSLRVGADAMMAAEGFLYNGERVWSGGGRCCCKSLSEGWVLLEDWAEAREPAASVGLDGTTYEGDAWWRLGAAPGVDNPAPSLVPRGTLLNQAAPAAPSLRWVWPRWQRNSGQSWDAPLGVYAGVDGAEDAAAVRTVGCLVLRDDGGADWTESADGSAFSCPARGLTLREEDGAWVAGDRPDGAWWEASGRPSRRDGCTLSPRGADAESRTVIRLEFRKFDWAAGTVRAWAAEVALWR